MGAANAKRRPEDVDKILDDERKLFGEDKDLWALCLSGGGIRSATYSLGVLQGLAQKGLLDKFHYLSTVSGGGYIGSWLSSWIARSNRTAVIAALTASTTTEPVEITRLRAYSNYLSPVWGLSTDFFTLISTFLRNLLLNWSVFLPLLAAMLLLPRIYLALLGVSGNGPLWWVLLGILLLVAAASLVFGIAYVVADLPVRETGPRDTKRPQPRDLFPWCCFLPILLAALLLSVLGGWAAANIAALGFWLGLGAFAAAGAAVNWIGRHIGMKWRLWHLIALERAKPRDDLALRILINTLVIVSGAGGGVILLALAKHVTPLMSDDREIYATVAVPLLVLGFWLATTLYVGLARRISSEMEREWWGRSGAWWLRACVGWALGLMLVIYAPRWAFHIPGLADTSSSALTLGSGGLGLGAITGLIGYWSKNGESLTRQAQSFASAIGTRVLDLAAIAAMLILVLVMAYGVSITLDHHPFCFVHIPIHIGCVTPEKANSDGTSNKSDKKDAARTPLEAAQLTEAAAKATEAAAKATEAAAKSVASPGDVHDALTLAARSAAHAALLEAKATEASAMNAPAQTIVPGPAAAYATGLQHGQLGPSLLLFGLLLAFGLAISWFVGINTFSLHSLYGNRLVRAYLGATNKDRKPHWFTGFDPDDNIDLQRMAPSGSPPEKLFHIINTTLNLAKPSGDRLEWQQRKAASFTFSPLHAGSPDVGYVPVRIYGGKHGASLGRAMAISGAAASPNMGYHTSASVAFIMAFLNIRLGWWQPNPKRPHYWQRGEPRISIGPLISEAFAESTDTSHFVYLSDGGHFDNLGLYEMVRRRCCRIMVVDAGCDPKFAFGDLENAIRKIRIDLGVPIVFDETSPPLTPGQSRANGGHHYVLAKILYSGEDDAATNGSLCYIKPVLSGDEPLDVMRYAATHATGDTPFPHQSTADQFFDEAQFESYRMLGLHSMGKGFENAGEWPAQPQSKPEPKPRPTLPIRLVGPATDGGKPAAALPSTDGVLSKAASTIQSMSQGALVASAITVGGVLGVSGTVALKSGSSVPLDTRGAEINLSAADRALLQRGLNLNVPPIAAQLTSLDDAARRLASAISGLSPNPPFAQTLKDSRSRSTR